MFAVLIKSRHPCCPNGYKTSRSEQALHLSAVVPIRGPIFPGVTRLTVFPAKATERKRAGWIGCMSNLLQEAEKTLCLNPKFMSIRNEVRRGAFKVRAGLNKLVLDAKLWCIFLSTVEGTHRLLWSQTKLHTLFVITSVSALQMLLCDCASHSPQSLP